MKVYHSYTISFV